jgi:hypothetical protein
MNKNLEESGSYNVSIYNVCNQEINNEWCLV